jgi:HlyD family secretion protein
MPLFSPPERTAITPNPEAPIAKGSEPAGLPVKQNLPVPVPPAAKPKQKRPILKYLGVGLLLLLVAAGGGYKWWKQAQSALPAGIVSGNGRIEADEIDIDTKFAGRIAELFVDEGDMVTKGQVLARMDTRDLEAMRHRDQAQLAMAERVVEENAANIAQQKTQIKLAEKELDRSNTLLRQGFATHELVDQRQQTLDGANAGLRSLEARWVQAQRAVDAAEHAVELDEVNIADNTLVAPRAGRIQYRIANNGEVLPAGGKVFVMLDTSYVYMDIYLPTLEAGKVKLGSEARIVLDAFPKLPLPATVTFLATEAQFTPKDVETKTERDRLMFRVRAHIDRDLLAAHAASVRTGLPGVTYIKLDPNLAWPQNLQSEFTK